MKLHRITASVTAAAAAAAAIAIASGGAVTHDSAVPATLSDDSQSIISNAHPASSDPAKVHIAASKPPHVDPSLAWLVSRGGQAQVAFNNAVAVMAGDLEIESHSSTVANHLAFEADARVVRSQAQKILATRYLLPTHNRAAYKKMLKDFIVVANLLQPGPGYGTASQDYTAWYTALKASNITVW